jgi:hypothetical protein
VAEILWDCPASAELESGRIPLSPL